MTVNEGTVSTSRQFSVGVSSINNALVTVNKTEVNTIDHQSPAFYVHNGGEMTVTEAFGRNTGQASPEFYVGGGKISATKCRLNSAKWTIGSVDTGLLEVSASELKSGGICGFLVYGANDKVNELRALDRLVLVKNKITAKYIRMGTSKISFKGVWSTLTNGMATAALAAKGMALALELDADGRISAEVDDPEYDASLTSGSLGLGVGSYAAAFAGSYTAVLPEKSESGDTDSEGIQP